MSPTNYSRYKYTPDEMNQAEFLARFVVRDDKFTYIFDDIQSSDYSVPPQHYIIIGQRGQGKTTLLRKILIEVERDEKLSKFLIPVKFAEEQYQIRSLCRLWEEVADYLQSLHYDDFPDILDSIEKHIDDENYDLKCFSYLEKKVRARDKKLVLLIDNIDEFLGKLKEKEQRQLRRILRTSSLFRIISGSTKMLEQHFHYGKQYYEFLNIVKLQGLNREESMRFLLSIGTDRQKAKMKWVADRNPQRIETLRRITGGVPRTLVMLFDIFIDDEGNAFDDLLKVLDEVTPLYKHRMDDLPPPLQDIVHTIAMNWDGMTTREIAQKTRLESTVVSDQLKQLTDKYQIIESESIGNNKIYKLQERFFNIWYLMRFGRKKDRQRVEWLVKFLISWCTPKELEERANKFIAAIKYGDVNEQYAYNMCEALSYAGLKRDTEYQMKQSVKTHLSSLSSDLANNLSPSDKEMIDQANILIHKQEYDNAIKLLLTSKKDSKDILFFLGWLYDEQKDHKKAEEYYLKAIESGDSNALRNLGFLYKEQKEYKKAEEYYLKAIESGDNGALRNLGILHKEQKKYKEAKECYFRAIEYGDNGALNNLGNLCDEQKEYERAEEYYLKAIESGDNDALNNLSWFYFEQSKNITKAVELAQQDYYNNRDPLIIHTLAVILLWQEEFAGSYQKLIEFLEFDGVREYEEDMSLYLALLVSKGQHHKAKALMEIPKYQLKERYKSIWYALMDLMKDEYPHEIKKMGSELRESVDEVLVEIEGLAKKYSLDYFYGSGVEYTPLPFKILKTKNR
ncbi:MAG: tetratricopeptide repeat protein [Campylobacterota bacterium]|nr:tetratricopeptide repeat protein [Campylobacterota bacterium]